MKSIRTQIPKHSKGTFESFLEIAKLTNIKIGDYQYIDQRFYMDDRICFMYNEKDSETVARLTHLMLKYGTIDEAYKFVMNQIYSSTLNDANITAFEL